MGVRFSLIYPTRHRPAFIRQALRFLEKQEYQDFEVIVSDNYVDPALSCENECRNSPLPNLKYVRPPRPVGMVENWNYAFQFAAGDYICYLTDLMFLLPCTLSMADNCIEKSRPDIVNWIDNSYRPQKFPDYFGKGEYVQGTNSMQVETEYYAHHLQKELSVKGRALVSRAEQDRSEYIRGKICFGAYSHELCDRIITRTGALFHNVAPDYTSMILALSLARSAVELNRPGMVHVSTDLSNGNRVSTNDEIALKFLSELDHTEEILKNFLIPGLYSSLHNIVSHDYLTLKTKYDLTFEFDPINWLIYIAEDLNDPKRQWSSKEVEKQQWEIFQSFINHLPKSHRRKYEKRCDARLRKKNELAKRAKLEQERENRRRLYKQSAMRFSKRFIRALLPQEVIRKLKDRIGEPSTEVLPNQPLPLQSQPQYCSHIEDILK